MANTSSAAKRARQTARRTLRNRRVLSRLRSLQKKSSSDVRSLMSEIDKAAKRGVIHKNAANRRKARLKKAAATTPTA
ncbi:MAG: 30S ribosomal protein S20 [Chthoniobacterales bacterium]